MGRRSTSSRVATTTLPPGRWPLAERYHGALEAPRGKELVWFEHSGHALRAEEPEKFDKEMLRVLRETYPREG